MDVARAMTQRIRLARLPRNRAHAVRLVPDAGQLEALGDRLDLSQLRKLRFEGELRPVEGGWALVARLAATVTQPCRVTTEPVTTRIDEPVERRWIEGWVAPDDGDEDTLDDSTDALPATLDLGAVLEEALSLAVPSYPRAPGVEEVELNAGPPGAEPLTLEARRPFAGLAALRDRMGRDGRDDGSE
jgi:uncharacterized metal-binding protein YceD (DUF177 family)